jgi:hypothetical protein
MKDQRCDPARHRQGQRQHVTGSAVNNRNWATNCSLSALPPTIHSVNANWARGAVRFSVTPRLSAGSASAIIRAAPNIRERR